jgi:hypothetical protein
MAKLKLRNPIKSLSGRLSRDITIKHFKDSGLTLMVAPRGPDRVRRQQPREAAAQKAFRDAVSAVRKLLKNPDKIKLYEAKVRQQKRQGRNVNAWNLALSDYIKSHPLP